MIAGDTGQGFTFETLRIFGDVSSAGGSPSGRLTAGSDGWLYGVCAAGGIDDRGTVFKVARDGIGYRVIHAFGSIEDDGSSPTGVLIDGGGGFLYGTTGGGGSYGLGTVFRLSKDGNRYSVLRSFGIGLTDGQHPISSLVMGMDGVLYGATEGGGMRGSGTVFRVETNGRNYQIVHHFRTVSRDGRGPSALILGTDGVLYGATTAGGDADGGTLFKLDPVSRGYARIWSLVGAAGGSVQAAGLVEGSDGRIYGIATDGGTAGAGSVFGTSKDGTGFSEIFSFSVSDNRKPVHGLIERDDGFLYGVTDQGGEEGVGALYRLRKDGGQFSNVISFRAARGTRPSGPLADIGDGHLYGPLMRGGASDGGVLFRVRLGDTSYQELYTFSLSGGDGSTPRGQLVLGTDGWIYGHTRDGGLFGDGTLFRLKKDGSQYQLLESFSMSSEFGAHPSSLFVDRDGDLVGTVDDGDRGGGVVFRRMEDGQMKVLHRFTDSNRDGAHPNSVLEGSDGKLYGTTRSGGLWAGGTLFRMEFDGSGFSVRHSFGAAAGDPRDPSGALLHDRHGSLYGATTGGGLQNGGTLFRAGSGGDEFTVLHEFDASPESAEADIWIIESDDHWIGTRSVGGAFQQGMVFRLGLDGAGFEVLHSFGAEPGDGRQPASGLVRLKDHSLVGVTRRGGLLDRGAIFRVDSSGVAIVHSFRAVDSGDGTGPAGPLFAGADGFCYGAAETGGNGFGTVYRFSTINPRIEIVRMPSFVRLSWVAVEGCRYRLQWGSSLTPSSWVDAPVSIRVENGTAYVDDPVLSASPRYYRVSLE